MTESEDLVWFEADGTRHVLGEPPSVAGEVAPTEAVAVEAAPVEAAPTDAAADEQAEPESPKLETSAVTGESETEDAETEEPSALRGMMRALALGAAAAAATGAAVGAISLAATGDRPDTTGETVPSTLVAGEDSSGPVRTETSAVDGVELVPPTTSAGQPG